MIRRHATGAFDCGLRCGDKVVRLDEEPKNREGRIQSITSNRVHVQWDDTGFHEYGIRPDELKVVRPYGSVRLDDFAGTFGEAVREASARDLRGEIYGVTKK
jgi:hypothetical protein